jgi:hypothetical protein
MSHESDGVTNRSFSSVAPATEATNWLRNQQTNFLNKFLIKMLTNYILNEVLHKKLQDMEEFDKKTQDFL